MRFGGDPWTQSPDSDSGHGDMECHLAGGKEPELLLEVEQYRLEIVGLTSMHNLGSGTQLLYRGWTSFYYGVARGEKQQAGVGLLIAPQLSCHVLEFSLVNERVVSLCLWVGDRSLTVVSGHQNCYSGGVELLTLTGDIVGSWKEYFEDLLNSTGRPSIEEAEAGDSEVDSIITQAKVTEVVWKLLIGKTLGVDEICPEYLKSLDVVGLYWLTHLCSIEWQLGTVADRVVVPLFKNGDQRVGSHSSAFLGKSTPGYWRGEFSR